MLRKILVSEPVVHRIGMCFDADAGTIKRIIQQIIKNIEILIYEDLTCCKSTKVVFRRDEQRPDAVPESPLYVMYWPRNQRPYLLNSPSFRYFADNHRRPSLLMD